MHVIVEHCECEVMCLLFGKNLQTGKHATSSLMMVSPVLMHATGTGNAFILLFANFKYGKLTNASVTDKSKMFCLMCAPKTEPSTLTLVMYTTVLSFFCETLNGADNNTIKKK